MSEVVLRYADANRPLRILDLGCGTGVLAFRLADALPQASITGLDISHANIDAAEAARHQSKAAPRLRFIHADYLEYRDDPYDLIVTDGVLHLVPVGTARLVRKLAADATRGGQLVVCMPYRCTYNSVFAGVRGVLRAIRNPLFDRGIMAAGRVLHPDASAEMLLERVHYMYRPPERVMGPQLRREFVSAGLQQEAEYPMPSSSLAQLRHSVTVWRKGA
jgi:trans-aconitate methyltransferase